MRDGDLAGKGGVHYVPQPFIPRWIWWAAAAMLLFLKGHHLIAFIKTRNIGKLANVALPSWLQRKKSPQ